MNGARDTIVRFVANWPANPRLRAWLRAMAFGALLSALAQLVWHVAIVGTYEYRAVVLRGPDNAPRGPGFEVYFDSERAPQTFWINSKDRSFDAFLGAGPVYSTQSRATVTVIPSRKRDIYGSTQFEIAYGKNGCIPAIYVAQSEPRFLGCANRHTGFK
jgi:hypothetical protein